MTTENAKTEVLTEDAILADEELVNEILNAKSTGVVYTLEQMREWIKQNR